MNPLSKSSFPHSLKSVRRVEAVEAIIVFFRGMG
jgi:hypothetical protein